MVLFSQSGQLFVIVLPQMKKQKSLVKTKYTFLYFILLLDILNMSFPLQSDNLTCFLTVLL